MVNKYVWIAARPGHAMGNPKYSPPFHAGKLSTISEFNHDTFVGRDGLSHTTKLVRAESMCNRSLVIMTVDSMTPYSLGEFQKSRQRICRHCLSRIDKGD